jgi:hypothetical protein
LINLTSRLELKTLLNPEEWPMGEQTRARLLEIFDVGTTKARAFLFPLSTFPSLSFCYFIVCFLFVRFSIDRLQWDAGLPGVLYDDDLPQEPTAVVQGSHLHGLLQGVGCDGVARTTALHGYGNMH